ncbi:MAG: XRE family transcriptional regulator [Pseudomonadota bacterium]
MAYSRPIDTHPALGRDLRALRKTRGLTLGALATRIGKSIGWLSEVERDLKTPAMDDLQAIAAALDVPVSILFGAPASAAEAGHVVRAGAGRTLGDREAGLTETLLSPDLTDAFEVIHSRFAPGTARTVPVSRPTQELATITAGRLDVWLDDAGFTLGKGDSLRIRGQCYRWANPYDIPAEAIWVIAPPVY